MKAFQSQLHDEAGQLRCFPVSGECAGLCDVMVRCDTALLATATGRCDRRALQTPFLVIASTICLQCMGCLACSRSFTAALSWLSPSSRPSPASRRCPASRGPWSSGPVGPSLCRLSASSPLHSFSSFDSPFCPDSRFFARPPRLGEQDSHSLDGREESRQMRAALSPAQGGSIRDGSHHG